VPARETPQRPVGPISPALTQQAERELMIRLGPIARLLVKRMLETATSGDDFCRRLSTHIEREADREAFLRKLRGF
jgi:hypothetical protein